MIQMTTWGRPTDFMVDPGAELSMATQPVGPPLTETSHYLGATGDQTPPPFLLPR